jgi:hypothetical protein
LAVVARAVAVADARGVARIRAGAPGGPPVRSQADQAASCGFRVRSEYDQFDTVAAAARDVMHWSRTA